LLRRHYDRIHAVCRRLAGNDADADDATQEAMLAVVRGLGRFAGQSQFSTWVYRVSVNACLDELRRRRRRPEPTELPEPPAGPGSDAGMAERLDIDAALALLPPDFRAAVVLRDLCRLDYADIAAVLEIPIGTVRSRIARGRAALVPLLDAGELPDRPPASNH
jgi:RNA polymerase sigma-70 factor (ECF subfamily)